MRITAHVVSPFFHGPVWIGLIFGVMCAFILLVHLHFGDEFWRCGDARASAGWLATLCTLSAPSSSFMRIAGFDLALATAYFNLMISSSSAD